MLAYTAISIIYNPNSTGDSKTLAQSVAAELQQKLRDIPIKLLPTTHRGHAETLAYTAALATARPLIISSSGDGGYHEVVNGLLRAQAKGARPVASLLPAGNANDHHAAVRTTDDIVQHITVRAERSIDVLCLSGAKKGQPFKRYAHSYIGFGLTPQAGQELNKTNLNRLKEMWIVAKSLIRLRPTVLIIGNKPTEIDSLICSNIPTMSKYLTLSSNAQLDDGKFELTIHKHQNRLKFIGSLAKASALSSNTTESINACTLQTVRRTSVQLDGEISVLDAGSHVTISAEPQQLRCVL